MGIGIGWSISKNWAPHDISCPFISASKSRFVELPFWQEESGLVEWKIYKRSIQLMVSCHFNQIQTPGSIRVPLVISTLQPIEGPCDQLENWLSHIVSLLKSTQKPSIIIPKTVLWLSHHQKSPPRCSRSCSFWNFRISFSCLTTGTKQHSSACTGRFSSTVGVAIP